MTGSGGDGGPDDIVERSPDGRYSRVRPPPPPPPPPTSHPPLPPRAPPLSFNCQPGWGAVQAVYKAYDEEEGIEVAWCQVSLDRVGEEEKSHIYKEVEILKRLSHKNILTFFAYFDLPDRNQLVFVTEIMTSGTLKQCARRRAHRPPRA